MVTLPLLLALGWRGAKWLAWSVWLERDIRSRQRLQRPWCHGATVVQEGIFKPAPPTCRCQLHHIEHFGGGDVIIVVSLDVAKRLEEHGGIVSVSQFAFGNANNPVNNSLVEQLGHLL